MTKIIRSLFLVLCMFMFSMGWVQQADAKGGILKRSAVAGKRAHKTKKVTPIKEPGAKQVEKLGPHMYILPTDLTAAELHTLMEANGLKGAELDACWRGDTTGVTDALQCCEDHLWRVYAEFDYFAKHSPVIWYSFEYKPEVIRARQKDRYTGKYKDSQLACQSAGGVERWDPYRCNEKDRRTFGLPMVQREDCEAPEEKFPKLFKAGQAIWVTDK